MSFKLRSYLNEIVKDFIIFNDHFLDEYILAYQRCTLQFERWQKGNLLMVLKNKNFSFPDTAKPNIPFSLQSKMPFLASPFFFTLPHEASYQEPLTRLDPLTIFRFIFDHIRTMGKIWVEVSMISAQGLRRFSLLKLQWFAVGWIDPKNKYCTRVDASGNSNPHWNTKFATLIDSSDSGFGDLALHIEVYSREPIFLRESLLGTATILLKEFLLKRSKDGSVSTKAIEEVGSYHLQKGNSSKPQGFVDISVRISEEQNKPSSYIGKN